MDADARLSHLRAQAGRVLRTPLPRLIASDPARAFDMALRVGPVRPAPPTRRLGPVPLAEAAHSFHTARAPAKAASMAGTRAPRHRA